MTTATTDQKARLLDLTTGILEMVRDGNRTIEEVLGIFQLIKDHSNFTEVLSVNLLKLADSALMPAKEQKTTLSIDRSVPNPAEFIGAGWTIWRGPADGDGLSGEEEQDERSLALTELDPAKILLETCFQDDEKRITGEERILRLKAAGRIPLDAAIFHAFWRHESLIPKEWKEKINTYTAYIFFDGTPLRGPDGDRYTLCLYFHDGTWGWDYDWLGGGRPAGLPSAVLASI